MFAFHSKSQSEEVGGLPSPTSAQQPRRQEESRQGQAAPEGICQAPGGTDRGEQETPHEGRGPHEGTESP